MVGMQRAAVRMRGVVLAVGVVGAVVVGAGCVPLPELPDDELSQCEVERRTIETALEVWLIVEGEGSYPATLEELVGEYVEDITIDWLYGSDGETYSMFGPC